MLQLILVPHTSIIAHVPTGDTIPGIPLLLLMLPDWAPIQLFLQNLQRGVCTMGAKVDADTRFC